jgi:ABC-2 type transport system permease protein
MRRTLNLALAEAKLVFWSMKRYMLDTLAGIGIMFLIFMGMFWGVKTIGGSGVTGESLDDMLVGYILWMSAMFCMQSTGSEITTESQRGTLEQLYLSPLGAHRVLFFRALMNMVFNFFFVTVLLYLSMAATGRWLSVNLPFLYAMVLLSTLSLVGISFMLGGISLIHKRIQALGGILSFGLIGLMLLPTYPMNACSFMPFIAGAALVRNTIVSGDSYPIWWYGFVAANSAFYLLAGLMIFKVFERRAMKLNKMGQY